jgi:hypothetical protein
LLTEVRIPSDPEVVVVVVVVVGINVWQRERLFRKLVGEFKEWMEPYQRRLSDVNRFLLNEEVLRFAFSEYPRELIARLWRDVVKDNYTEIDPMDGERCLRRK